MKYAEVQPVDPYRRENQVIIELIWNSPKVTIVDNPRKNAKYKRLLPDTKRELIDLVKNGSSIFKVTLNFLRLQNNCKSTIRQQNRFSRSWGLKITWRQKAKEQMKPHPSFQLLLNYNRNSLEVSKTDHIGI